MVIKILFFGTIIFLNYNHLFLFKLEIIVQKRGFESLFLKIKECL